MSAIAGARRILVTGGTGYLGSHTALVLAQAGYEVVLFDDLSNSYAENVENLRTSSGAELPFVRGSLLDVDALDRVFAAHRIDAVLHFAGLKSVPQSRLRPAEYHAVNVEGTDRLCEAMQRHGVFRLVFSSSAAVYGDAARMPVREDDPLAPPTSPYAASKREAERRLDALAAADARWSIALLRYFNPGGAHPDGRLGNRPLHAAEDLISRLDQIARGERDVLEVLGDDYPTPDGTCVRDYVHVMDLAEGHLGALDAISAHAGARVWNLGSGRGYSVLEMLHAFERVAAMPLPRRIAPRRDGDIALSWADIGRARSEFGWSPRRSLEQMIEDQLRWSRRAKR